MKSISFLLLLVMMCFITYSCSLDPEDDGRMAIEEVFDKYNYTLNYVDICRSYIPQLSFDRNDGTALASYCDEAQDSYDNQSDAAVYKWYDDQASAINYPLNKTYNYWDEMFKGIKRCNIFLANIDHVTFDMNEVERTGWIAEVRVMRAFYYLQLIKRFGGVPIMKDSYAVDHGYGSDVRNTFEECADFILEECDWALAVPESSDASIGFRWNVSDAERGRLTRGFAWAVKSEAVLYAASPLWSSNGTGKYTWAKATEITKAALDQLLAHGYELYNADVDPTVAQNAYAYYFITQSDPSRSIDKETIYQSQERLKIWSNAGVPITSGMSKAGPCPTQELIDAYEMADGTVPILGYSDANHLQPIVNTASSYDPDNPYENRDPRFYASIYYNGAVRNLRSPSGLKVMTYVGGNCEISDRVTDVRYTRTGYYMRKFNNNTSSSNANNDGYMSTFRLAEMYLNFAEAAYQANGPEAQVSSTVGGVSMSAKDAVDAVRARAGMPSLPAGLSKDDFEKRYRNERRIELAFEEHRFFDVRRWKILNETDKAVTGMRITQHEDGSYTYTRFKFDDRNTNTDKYLMYPVDETEASKMERLTGNDWQNPGW